MGSPDRFIEHHPGRGDNRFHAMEHRTRKEV